MTSIDVTPAGNQLYQVDIRDADGESRHEIGMPDELLSHLDLDGISIQDVILAAVELLVAREGRQQLDRELDLGVIAERYEDFTEQVLHRARERATTQSPLPGTRTTDRGAPTGDARLVAEVEEEQRSGQASRQDPLR